MVKKKVLIVFNAACEKRVKEAFQLDLNLEE